MNAITRYIRYSLEISMKDMTMPQLLEALEFIYDNHTEAYFKRVYSNVMYNHRLPLANEIYNHGYYNIDWEDLDVMYFREYREVKERHEREEDEERERQEQEEQDDYTTSEED
jgi:hypothetical protein